MCFVPGLCLIIAFGVLATPCNSWVEGSCILAHRVSALGYGSFLLLAQTLLLY